MKYYDLVFEVGIEKQYLSWVLRTVGPFRVLLKAPFAVLGYRPSAAFYWLSFFVSSTVMTSFISLYLSHWYHNTVTVGVRWPSAQPHIFMHILCTIPHFCDVMCVDVVVEKTNLG